MKPLEAGQLWVMRVRAALVALVLLVAATAAEIILEHDRLPDGLIVAAVLPVVVWLVLIAPRRRWRAWGYRAGDTDLELAHGVWTQVRTLVPLDRVQHIDISQGPLERMFGVCRLVLHTAGTAHSLVLLPGLARDTAERMRDEIRARIGEERA
ncbi:PH domain-containing protein [Sphingomonas parva]|nr:PH domain-containing protein [Sphingomonas parva]